MLGAAPPREGSPVPVLTRPEGTPPSDLHLSRRGFASLFATGYAAYALSAQAEPIRTDAQGLVTTETTIATGGAAMPAYVARPDGRGRFGAVIVVNEVFGVHEYIRDVCRRFAKLGYVAIAPQLFFRADPQNTLATTQDFSTITKIVGTAKNAQVMGDLQAVIAWLDAQPFVDRKRLGITGFCWGGAVVWEAATRFPELKAGVAWYGRLSPPKAGEFMGDDARQWPLQQVKDMQVPVLGLYGGLDKGIPTADVDAMRASLKAAGKTGYELVTYPDAQHGFHADYRSSYNEKDAQDGWARLQAFFKAHHLAPGPARGMFG
jgi:carboxymethylenebutenolidase